MERILYDSYTYEEYLSLLDEGLDIEYDNGNIFYMSPVKPNHDRVKSFISNKLINSLGFNGECEVFTSDVSVLFSNSNEKYEFLPDIMVCCDNNFDKSRYVGKPSLVVEILSYATKDRDKNIKLEVYQKFGVKEYWIIDIDSKSIKIFNRNINRKFNSINEYNISDIIEIFHTEINLEELFSILR